MQGCEEELAKNKILTIGNETEWRGEEKMEGELWCQSSCSFKIEQPHEGRGSMPGERGEWKTTQQKETQEGCWGRETP